MGLGITIKDLFYLEGGEKIDYKKTDFEMSKPPPQRLSEHSSCNLSKSITIHYKNAIKWNAS